MKTLSLLFAILLCAASSQAGVTLNGNVHLSGKATFNTIIKQLVKQDSYTNSTAGVINVSRTGGGERWTAIKFTASKTYILSSVNLPLTVVGSPTYNLRVEILSDASGTPSTVLGNSSYVVANTVSNATIFAVSNTSISSGTTYWIAVHTSNSSFTDYLTWRTYSSGSNPAADYISSNGTSWSGEGSGFASAGFVTYSTQ